MKPGSLQGILNDRPYAHAKSVDKADVARCRVSLNGSSRNWTARTKC
jgi:hypothetical protein